MSRKCGHANAHSFRKAGLIYLRCGCGLETVTGRADATECFLHRREDWRDAEALKAARSAVATVAPLSDEMALRRAQSVRA
jgi:hypothetical protein